MIKERLYPCENPACTRKVEKWALYCCTPCSYAHEDKWDINGEHSEGCNERHNERSKDKRN